uniref:LytTR family transcriptional regulator DNA-binding domain-containing protein n=1 Tax=Catenibacterium sp. TaxID=2049022 RepID=UPI003FD78393
TSYTWQSEPHGLARGSSQIINLKMVQEITKDLALLVDGTSIPISRSYYKALKDRINNLIP